MRIEKNKFGELTPPPDFGDKAILFHRLAHTPPAMREGDEWEFSEISRKPQNKADRHGTPMWTVVLKPVRQVLDIRQSFDYDTRLFRRESWCGSNLLKAETLQPEKVTVTGYRSGVGMNGKLWVTEDREYTLPIPGADRQRNAEATIVSALFGKGDLSYQEKAVAYINLTFKQWWNIPAAKAVAGETISEHNKQKRARKKRLANAIAEIATSAPFPSDPVLAFLQTPPACTPPAGDCLNALNGLEESIFSFCGYKFALNVKSVDEDSVFWSDPKLLQRDNIEDRLLWSCYDWASSPYFVGNSTRSLPGYVEDAIRWGRPLPKARVLWEKDYKKVSSSSSPRGDAGEVINYMTEEQCLSHAQEEYKFASLPPEVVEDYNYFKAIFSPRITLAKAHYHWGEEGVGARDATYISVETWGYAVLLEWECRITGIDSFDASIKEVIRHKLRDCEVNGGWTNYHYLETRTEPATQEVRIYDNFRDAAPGYYIKGETEYKKTGQAGGVYVKKNDSWVLVDPAEIEGAVWRGHL